MIVLTMLNDAVYFSLCQLYTPTSGTTSSNRSVLAF